MGAKVLDPKEKYLKRMAAATKRNAVKSAKKKNKKIKQIAEQLKRQKLHAKIEAEGPRDFGLIPPVEIEQTT